jgi:hypothetical protein
LHLQSRTPRANLRRRIIVDLSAVLAMKDNHRFAAEES